MKAAINAIVDLIRREPAIISQLIPLLAAAAAVFGLKLSPENVAEIVAIAEAVAIILVRQNVTPVVSLPAASVVPKAPAA
jgi:drug/metabolite transporter (DMT)-like permease